MTRIPTINNNAIRNADKIHDTGNQNYDIIYARYHADDTTWFMGSRIIEKWEDTYASLKYADTTKKFIHTKFDTLVFWEGR